MITLLLLSTALLVIPPRGARELGRTRLPVRRPAGRRPVLTVAAVLAIAGVVLAVPPAFSAAGLAAAATAEIRRRRTARGRRGRSEARAMAASLEVLTGELRVGAHPLRAFTVAANESPDPVGAHFRSIAIRAGIGADVATGIRAISAASAAPAYWERVAVSWDLAAQHGLAMSSLMGAAHRDIVERQRFADRMHAALAGSRATAVILSGLPVLGVVLGELIGAQPIRFLSDGVVGGCLLVVGVGLACVGILWSDRIVGRVVG